MSDPKGHAAFHLAHVAHGARGNRGDRRGLLHESMRHLDPKDVVRHAEKNPSIVPAEAHLNTGFVNDGAGGFREATTIKDVLDYGDARVQRVRRKMTQAQAETSTVVVHLPKTMCEEIPNYYPRVNKAGQPRLDPETGEPMSRSRWVARDRDEAMRYFQDAVEYLGTDVIPGGQAAIHGWATNFDETTPHIQLMGDPFAPDPKAPDDQPDALRTEHSQAYRAHREITDDAGRQVSGAAKMRAYQAGMREHMITRGWPVEQEVSKRHGKEMTKSEYEQAMDTGAELRRQIDVNNAALDKFRVARADAEARYGAATTELEQREAAVAAGKKAVGVGEGRNAKTRAALDEELAGLPRLRRKAAEEGKAEGVAAAERRVDEMVDVRVEEALRTARATLQRQRDELDEEQARGRAELRQLKHNFMEAAKEAEQRSLKHTDAAERFEGLNARLEPAVRKWEQLNPVTKNGAAAQRNLAAVDKIRKAAAAIEAETPSDEFEYGA